MNDSAVHTDVFASFQKHLWKCNYEKIMGWQQIFGDVNGQYVYNVIASFLPSKVSIGGFENI